MSEAACCSVCSQTAMEHISLSFQLDGRTTFQTQRSCRGLRWSAFMPWCWGLGFARQDMLFACLISAFPRDSSRCAQESVPVEAGWNAAKAKWTIPSSAAVSAITLNRCTRCGHLWTTPVSLLSKARESGHLIPPSPGHHQFHHQFHNCTHLLGACIGLIIHLRARRAQDPQWSHACLCRWKRNILVWSSNLSHLFSLLAGGVAWHCLSVLSRQETLTWIVLHWTKSPNY